MNDIERCLRQEDFCGEMFTLGFELKAFEDGDTEYFFVSADNELIVRYDSDKKHFWTYPIANNKACRNSEPIKMMTFEEWLKSDNGKTARDNWDNAGDYSDDEYDNFMKDKYEEYRAFGV